MESMIFEDDFSSGSVDIKDADAVLLKAGPLFALYRIVRDGKYFLFKTASGNKEYARELLRREYEMSIGCDHPNIVHVFVYGPEMPGREGIVMEYIEGRTLTEFIAENPDHAVRRKVFEQLLGAVEYLHKRGVVHNDIKPDNILITRSGNDLKLIDFGLSDKDAHYLIKTPGYTPGFSAPELSEERHSDVRSDVYSIGKIMRALFGRRYGRIIRKATSKNPKDRYLDVSLFLRAWNRRRLPLSITVSVGLLVLIGLGIWSMISDNDANREKVTAVESELTRQKEENMRQREAFDSLKRSYDNIFETYADISRNYDTVQGSYARVKNDYENLKESIERERLAAERHERLKKERIEGFEKELEKRFLPYHKEMTRRRNAKEGDWHRILFGDFCMEIHRYLKSIDKVLDGEDLSDIYEKKWEDFRERYSWKNYKPYTGDDL